MYSYFYEHSLYTYTTRRVTYFYNLINFRFYILQHQLRYVVGSLKYFDQKGSISNYIFNKSVMYLWFCMHTPEDFKRRRKIVVFFIWSNRLTMEHSMQTTYYTTAKTSRVVRRYRNLGYSITNLWVPWNQITVPWQIKVSWSNQDRVAGHLYGFYYMPRYKAFTATMPRN